MDGKFDNMVNMVFSNLKSLPHFIKYMKFMCDTACLSNKSKEQQEKETLDYLFSCAKIIVRNPNIAPDKIYGWWFGLKGYRKPRKLVLC